MVCKLRIYETTNLWKQRDSDTTKALPSGLQQDTAVVKSFQLIVLFYPEWPEVPCKVTVTTSRQMCLLLVLQQLDMAQCLSSHPSLRTISWRTTAQGILGRAITALIQNKYHRNYEKLDKTRTQKVKQRKRNV